MEKKAEKHKSRTLKEGWEGQDAAVDIKWAPFKDIQIYSRPKEFTPPKNKNTKGCELYLMPMHAEIRASGKNLLFLFKKDSSYFYFVKDKKIPLDYPYIKDLLQSADFSQDTAVKCEDPKIYNAVITITSERGHTAPVHDPNITAIKLFGFTVANIKRKEGPSKNASSDSLKKTDPNSSTHTDSDNSSQPSP